ncbi:MAG: MATE family efflux transporter [Treponema sp.]|nr:MATE family efflux transporter [Treponema sp.]
MAQNLINSLVNILDTVMIGRLGTVEIAAVGLGNNFFFLYNMFLFGICSGGSIFTAQFWGKKDTLGIRKNMGLCALLSLSMAILFTLATLFAPELILSVYSQDKALIPVGAIYLRALSPAFLPYAVSFVCILTLRSIERVRLTVVSTIIALSINLVLNYLFIFGLGAIPALGVLGAAIATVIARFTEAAILLIVSYTRRYAFIGPLRDYASFSLSFVQRFFRITLPVMLNEVIWSLGVSAQNIIFARTDTNAIAAFNITNTVSQLTWVFFIGLGNGAAVLIGKKIGEGNELEARDYAARIVCFAPLTAAGAAFVLIPLSQVLPFVFNVNEQLLRDVTLMLIILSCSYPFRAFNMAMIIGICRAGGDTVFSAIFDVAFMWVVSLPIAAAVSFFFHAPVWLIYICICTEEPLKMLVYLWRFKSGKWLRNVTD